MVKVLFLRWSIWLINWSYPFDDPWHLSTCLGLGIANEANSLTCFRVCINFIRVALIWNDRLSIKSMRPRQDGRHFPDDILIWIFLNENVWITIEISLKFVPKGPINNIPSLVQIMAWCRPGDKPLSEPMMGSLLTHICVTRPQWVKLALIFWTGLLLFKSPMHTYINNQA